MATRKRGVRPVAPVRTPGKGRIKPWVGPGGEAPIMPPGGGYRISALGKGGVVRQKPKKKTKKG